MRKISEYKKKSHLANVQGEILKIILILLTAKITAIAVVS